MSGAPGTPDHRGAAGSRGALERLEHEIDVTEAQLEGMREVRSSIVGKALPAIAVVGVLAYGAMGWEITEPLGAVFAVILLGAVAVLGVGAHLGVLQGERRLARLEEDLAIEVGSERARGRETGRVVERGTGTGDESATAPTEARPDGDGCP